LDGTGEGLMATLKFTIIGRYEAEAENYGSTDPKIMASEDQEQIDAGDVGLADVIEWAASRDISVKIEAE
jgi:hypothetical protein